MNLVTKKNEPESTPQETPPITLWDVFAENEEVREQAFQSLFPNADAARKEVNQIRYWIRYHHYRHDDDFMIERRAMEHLIQMLYSRYPEIKPGAKRRQTL